MEEQKNTYYEDFKNRAKHLNLPLIYTEGKFKGNEPAGSSNSFLKVTIEVDAGKTDYLQRDAHTLMGLIYHFTNRFWIVYDSYMYIMKEVHTIRFPKMGQYLMIKCDKDTGKWDLYDKPHHVFEGSFTNDQDAGRWAIMNGYRATDYIGNIKPKK